MKMAMTAWKNVLKHYFLSQKSLETLFLYGKVLKMPDFDITELAY